MDKNKLPIQLYIIGGLVVCLVFVLLFMFVNTKPEVLNQQDRINSLKPYQPLPVDNKVNNNITITYEEVDVVSLISKTISYFPVLLILMILPIIMIFTMHRTSIFIIIMLLIPFVFIFFSGISRIIALLSLLAFPFIYITIKNSREF